LYVDGSGKIPLVLNNRDPSASDALVIQNSGNSSTSTIASPNRVIRTLLATSHGVRFPVRTSYIARWISTENRFGAVANAISFERISASVEPRRLIRHPPLGKAAVADGGVHEQPDEHDADDQDCGR